MARLGVQLLGTSTALPILGLQLLWCFYWLLRWVSSVAASLRYPFGANGSASLQSIPQPSPYFLLSIPFLPLLPSRCQFVSFLFPTSLSWHYVRNVLGRVLLFDPSRGQLWVLGAETQLKAIRRCQQLILRSVPFLLEITHRVDATRFKRSPRSTLLTSRVHGVVTLAPMPISPLPRTWIPIQMLHHAAAAPLPMEKVE